MIMNKKLFFVLLVACIPLFSLLSKGLPITHDGQDHVVRVANFFQSLSEGNLIPRWGNNLNWGFGHPVLMFLYPLPSYTSSLIHVMGFSFVDSIKIVFALAFVASSLSMYLFIKDEWGEHAGMIAAILYTFAPYRFVNLYVRGAFGEHAAFIFIPLLFWAIQGLAKKRSKLYWGLLVSLSEAGLLLTHNAVSIMVIPVLFCYLVYLLRFEVKNKKTFLVSVIVFVFYGVGLSAFFLFPAFLEGKYTLRDIVTKGEIVGRTVPLLHFFYSPWNYGGGNEFTKELGIPALISLLFSFLLVFKSANKKLRILTMGLIGLVILYVFLMTGVSLSIWNNLSILQKFQFPWRLLVVTTFLSSILGAITVTALFPKKSLYAVVFFLVLSLVSTFHMWKPKTYKVFEESFFTDIYNGTTDTGESSPIWSVRFMEYRPEVSMEISEGNVDIKPVKRNTTSREYTVNAFEKSRLVENTLYFPGWKVYIDNQEVPIQFQDPQWRGRMTFWVDPGKHTVLVKFSETKLRFVSNLISIISVFGLLPLFYFAKK